MYPTFYGPGSEQVETITKRGKEQKIKEPVAFMSYP